MVMALLGMSGGVGAVGFVWYYFSPRFTDVGYCPEQPVPYSHQLHAGVLGIDCRYCHAGVERGPFATLPPTQTCMNCHKTVNPGSALVAPVMTSWANDAPIPWVRVHHLPDFAHFNHAVHVAAGVGCASCHGRVDRMEVVHQAEPLSMGWCLECHRNPAPSLRPRDKVTDMAFQPSLKEGLFLQAQRAIDPPRNCSACHY